MGVFAFDLANDLLSYLLLIPLLICCQSLVPLRKFSDGHSYWVALLSYSDGLQHSGTSQLLADVIWVKFFGGKLGVGLDASDVARTRFSQSRDKVIQLVSELVRNAIALQAEFTHHVFLFLLGLRCLKQLRDKLLPTLLKDLGNIFIHTIFVFLNEGVYAVVYISGIMFNQKLFLLL